MNRGKKRKLKIDTWKQTVRKHQRDAGEAYISSRNVPKAALSQPEEEKYPDANNISFRVYHDIFKSKFNLRFGLPRSDTCSYCDKLFMKLCSTDDANEKKKIEIESEIHHRKL
ncbi:unnamed protein product [Acanthoscelides obtectus]|uniref:Uncharacterized protein n=1 Tax=Acanthoscelides obtectus TaxID=200917 RepID=A0A9P0QE31_ACAOB|nr:unnamed protein product [Acanthoscelides obtectus]CAK1687954.1 hypothetical protein AOBTE_LOCUS36473 [Acanthoscelides obtectus]